MITVNTNTRTLLIIILLTVENRSRNGGVLYAFPGEDRPRSTLFLFYGSRGKVFNKTRNMLDKQCQLIPYKLMRPLPFPHSNFLINAIFLNFRLRAMCLTTSMHNDATSKPKLKSSMSKGLKKRWFKWRMKKMSCR